MDERNNREHPDREQQDMPPQGDTGEYRWNFEEYENSLPPDPSGKKNRGLQVFITLVAGVLAVLLLGFAAYGVYEAFTGGGLLGSGDSSDSSSSESSLTTEEKVTISDTPGVEGEQSTGSAQSYSAIYKKVSPSVVGIVAYTSDENLTDVYKRQRPSGTGSLSQTCRSLTRRARSCLGKSRLPSRGERGSRRRAREAGSRLNPAVPAGAKRGNSA